ncbi:hypothetical protein Ciccas_014342, partial [Cichlidogyrus casuarinus]
MSIFSRQLSDDWCEINITGDVVRNEDVAFFIDTANDQSDDEADDIPSNDIGLKRFATMNNLSSSDANEIKRIERSMSNIRWEDTLGERIRASLSNLALYIFGKPRTEDTFASHVDSRIWVQDDNVEDVEHSTNELSDDQLTDVTSNLESSKSLNRLSVPNANEGKKVKKRNPLKKIFNGIKRSVSKLDLSTSSKPRREDTFASHVDSRIWVQDDSRGFRYRQILIKPPTTHSPYMLNRSQIQLKGSDREPNKFTKRLHGLLLAATIHRSGKKSYDWYEEMNKFLAGAFEGYGLYRNCLEFLPPGTVPRESLQKFEQERITSREFQADEHEQFHNYVHDMLFRDLSY